GGGRGDARLSARAQYGARRGRGGAHRPASARREADRVAAQSGRACVLALPEPEGEARAQSGADVRGEAAEGARRGRDHPGGVLRGSSRALLRAVSGGKYPGAAVRRSGGGSEGVLAADLPVPRRGSGVRESFGRGADQYGRGEEASRAVVGAVVPVAG